MKTDRDDIFGEIPQGTTMWCLHCERTYPHGEFREIKDPHPIPGEDDTLQMCPYEDCDGDVVIDSKEWDWVLEKHPDYPETPKHGEVYPLY